MRKIILGGVVLNIIVLALILLYCSDFIKLFKSDRQEFVIVQKADTLVFGDIIIRKFNNLKLVKTEFYGTYHYLLNKDTLEIRRYLKSRGYNENEDGSYILEDHLNRGLDYYSSFADKNYDKLPDTIWATGYEIKLYRFATMFDPVSARRIKIMSYKYKKEVM